MKIVPILKRLLLGYLGVELTGTLLVLPWLVGGLASMDAIYLTHNRLVVLIVLVAGVAGGYVLAIPASRLPRTWLKKAVRGH